MLLWARLIFMYLSVRSTETGLATTHKSARIRLNPNDGTQTLLIGVLENPRIYPTCLS